MTVTQNRISRRLFGRFEGTASWVDARVTPPIVYQFGLDSHWSKVLFSRKDDWIRQFRHENGPGGGFNAPSGLDVSGSRYLFIADPHKARVIVAGFDGDAVTPFSVITDGGRRCCWKRHTPSGWRLLFRCT
jgi:hypothetical protein